MSREYRENRGGYGRDNRRNDASERRNARGGRREYDSERKKKQGSYGERSYGESRGRNYDSDNKHSSRRDERAYKSFDEENEVSADYKPDVDMSATLLEGRNAVLEALRSDRSIDRVLVLDGNHDSGLGSIITELKKHPQTKLEFVSKQRLDQISITGGRHQGVIAYAAAYNYAELEDIFAKAEAKGEKPFVFLLDGIEDPHNLGAIIRTANMAGAHGVIIRMNRAVGLTATVAKASAGAINYTPIVKVTNIARTIDELKERGLWFVCADMGGESMYKLNLDGAIGLVIGNEGKGVSELVRKKCDMIASIPQFGDIDSLNASVAAGVLAYEVVRRRVSAAK